VLIDIDSEPISGCKRWDATEAINRALKNEAPLLSLHMSLGPYGSSNHYYDSETANPDNRPNLLVLFE
jgi:hypothetical protein